MVKRFGVDETAWLIEWSFDQLYGWHDWAWNNRQLVHSHGLIAPGSSLMPPGTGVPDCDRSGTGLADNLMQCARCTYSGEPNMSHPSVYACFQSSSGFIEQVDKLSLMIRETTIQCFGVSMYDTFVPRSRGDRHGQQPE